MTGPRKVAKTSNAMQGPKVIVGNVVLVNAGKVPSIAEVVCPTCGTVNYYKVKSYLGETGHETAARCSLCDAQIAFRWEKEVRIG